MSHHPQYAHLWQAISRVTDGWRDTTPAARDVASAVLAWDEQIAQLNQQGIAVPHSGHIRRAVDAIPDVRAALSHVEQFYIEAGRDIGVIPPPPRLRANKSAPYMAIKGKVKLLETLMAGVVRDLEALQYHLKRRRLFDKKRIGDVPPELLRAIRFKLEEGERMTKTDPTLNDLWNMDILDGFVKFTRLFNTPSTPIAKLIPLAKRVVASLREDFLLRNPEYRRYLESRGVLNKFSRGDDLRPRRNPPRMRL